MRRSGRYGRDFGGRGYDAGWRGYDRGWRAPWHDAGYYRDAPFPRRGQGPGPGHSPYDATGWALFAFSPFAFDPALGWAGWGPGTAYVPPGPPEPRRVPPRESGAYGHGGDRELREWAARAGYDVEYTIRPRRGPRRP